MVPASRIAPEPPADSLGGEHGDVAFLQRAEVRDVLAWMRLLVDPQDAAAVVRALTRPPIELRQVHLARVIQLARRRKLDLVAGLAAASESPQVPPEARERIERFVVLHRSAAAGLESRAPQAFLAELIELLGTRGRPLLTPEHAAEQRVSLQALRDLAVDFVRCEPHSTPRELARHLAAVGPEARGGAQEQVAPPPPASPAADAPPQDHLQTTLALMREEVLDSVGRIGGRLGELRLDTELDISHGVVRYLELLKLAALLQRPPGQELADALADINARLLAATTPVQREILQTSTLDDTLIGGERDDRSEAGQQVGRQIGRQIGRREEHSLGPFLPRKGVGLALSASDIETYRSCPLRYKFARVLRIPTEQTLHQRFGIVVHTVLERFHSDGLNSGAGQTLAQMLDLYDSVWRRAGFGDSARERELRQLGTTALTRYHARLHDQNSEPVWFERSFAFRIGPHHLRGRVDRVDRLTGGDAPGGGGDAPGGGGDAPGGGGDAPGGGGGDGEQYELIDYKTSRPKNAEQLKDDVQLSLYALAAREAWQLESSRQAYYYVLDDLKVPVPRGEQDAASVTDLVLEVGQGILEQAFEPTPSHAACSICDYRIVCPVAEK